MKKVAKIFVIVVWMVGFAACAPASKSRYGVVYKDGHFSLEGEGKVAQCDTDPVKQIDVGNLDTVLGKCERLLDGHKNVKREAAVIIHSTGSDCVTFYSASGRAKQICGTH